MRQKSPVYSRILVAIDDSPAGQAALDEATRLAKDQQAQLRIVHVLQTVASDGEDTAERMMDATLERNAQATLDGAAAYASQRGVAVIPTLIRDDRHRISAAIVADALQWEARLIVMGTSGPHRIGRVQLGSVAEGVIHAAPVPVLLVHQPKIPLP